MSQLQSASMRHRLVRVVGHRRAALSRAAAMVALGIAGTASAQNIWVGPTGAPSPWETPANWSLGSVPSGEVALINNGGIAQISSNVPEVLALQLGSDAGFSGAVVHDSGLLPLTTSLVLGNSANAAPTPAGVGTYTMNGGTLTGNDFYIGSKGAGTLNMNGGAITSTANMRLGDDIGSSGVLNMTGGVITLPNFLLVGHFSPAASPDVTTGSVNLSGGTITVANLNIGQHPNARGEVRQTGGWVQNTANTVIGEISRQENKYFLSGGTLRVAGGPGGGSLFAGSSAGIGALHVSGTGDAQIDGHIFAGSGTTALGTFTMSGGTVALGLNKPGGGFLVAGDFGTATVNISGGNFTGDFAQFGRRFNATSQGQITQTGGTVTVRRSINVSGLSANDNFYDISGGTLNLTNDTTVTTNETQPGIHVARFSTDPGAVEPVTGYSRGRFTVSGTANVNINGGLYNSTGFTPTTGANAGVPLPGGAGTIQVTGGTLTAGSFLNGGAANAGSYNNGGATANYLQSGGVTTFGPVTGTGNVTVSGGTMNVSSVQQANLTVSGGAVRVAPNGTSAGTSRVNSISTSGTGRFDLTNNALVVDYTGASPLADVRSQIVSAYAGGAWTGPGITSSNANATTHGLGYAEASALGTVPEIFGTVDTDAVLVRTTRYGDADLSGTVNLQDFNRLAANFGTGTRWDQGDFTYDGAVNLADFNRLAANFGQSAAGPDVTPQDWANLASAIPEPSGLAVVAVGALAAARRRRRNQAT